ncbi:catabolic 3-dehydroquinase 2 [Penicillium daleae]|uniref:Catabolic 3-dehydroquinase n=1 Tax=Penicillium daleae TaxID=63821 RepID=A0AAD6CH40_9EURO|nr:catabolic 3-dehydroquinase 2 [Penicillium daleae]KAJ5461912.1 catabolic 3-dehydroquinase 2 [Penicillium daleae]
MAKSILVINGPNLNLLGTREPAIYGYDTLDDLENKVKTVAGSLEVAVQFFQSNHEGAIIDRIHVAQKEKIEAIIINPAALTHTSVGLRDALNGVSIPFIEVHIANVHSREEFRHHSYLSDKAVSVICGMGIFGYEAALMYAAQHIGACRPEQ